MRKGTWGDEETTRMRVFLNDRIWIPCDYGVTHYHPSLRVARGLGFGLRTS
jgi:hypothetical protein